MPEYWCWEVREEDFTLLIANILEKFVGCRFDGIVISEVRMEYPIGGGRADIIIFAEVRGIGYGEQPFIVVEVKRTGTIAEGLEQAKEYAEGLRMYGYWKPPFVAVIKVSRSFEQDKLIESVTLFDTRTGRTITKIYGGPYEDINVSFELIESAVCTYTRKSKVSVSCPEWPPVQIDCSKYASNIPYLGY